MEILQSQDPEKKRLMDEAKRHKDNLANEVRMVSERTEKIITNAIVIGGALALTYVLVRQFSGGKSKKKKPKAIKIVAQAPREATDTQEEDEISPGDSLLAQIGTKIANEATVFLLNLAKEKLNEYLQSGSETSKSTNENH
jgi:hypothetical protein